LRPFKGLMSGKYDEIINFVINHIKKNI
jgi:hypothetical protein